MSKAKKGCSSCGGRKRKEALKSSEDAVESLDSPMPSRGQKIRDGRSRPEVVALRQEFAEKIRAAQTEEERRELIAERRLSIKNLREELRNSNKLDTKAQEGAGSPQMSQVKSIQVSPADSYFADILTLRVDKNVDAKIEEYISSDASEEDKAALILSAYKDAYAEYFSELSGKLEESLSLKAAYISDTLKHVNERVEEVRKSMEEDADVTPEKLEELGTLSLKKTKAMLKSHLSYLIRSNL